LINNFSAELQFFFFFLNALDFCGPCLEPWWFVQGLRFSVGWAAKPSFHRLYDIRKLISFITGAFQLRLDGWLAVTIMSAVLLYVTMLLYEGFQCLCYQSLLGWRVAIAHWEDIKAGLKSSSQLYDVLNAVMLAWLWWAAATGHKWTQSSSRIPSMGQ